MNKRIKKSCQSLTKLFDSAHVRYDMGGIRTVLAHKLIASEVSSLLYLRDVASQGIQELLEAFLCAKGNLGGI